MSRESSKWGCFTLSLEGIFVCHNKVGRFYEIDWVWGGTNCYLKMGLGEDLESVSNFGGMNYWIRE